MDSEILQGFLAQADGYLPTIRGGILVSSQAGNVYGELNNSLRQVNAIKDTAAMIGLDEIARVAGELEEKLKSLVSLKTPLTDEQSRGLLDKLAELEILLAHLLFSSDDSMHITDFVDESFMNLGLSETIRENTLVVKAAEDAWEEEFEIDEEMLEIFAEEAEELVQSISANLKLLEKNPNNREALLEIRRNAHTLKGSAGIVGLKVLSGVAHRVEDLLDYLAENEIESGEKIFELLLTAADCFIALASNEISPQLTAKIARLYEDFDQMLIALKSGARCQTAVASEPPPPAEKQRLSIAARSEPPSFEQPTAEQPTAAAAEPISIAARQSSKSDDEASVSQSEIVNHKSIVRVSLEKLDDLVKIMSGLVFSRSVFERRLAELEQQIGELHNSTRRLRHSTDKLETDFEANMLNVQPTSSGFQIADSRSGNAPSVVRHPPSFDALELDHYTEFHQTMRELLETTGDTSAIYSELDNLKGNLETLFENQRRLIEEMQDKLLRLRMVSFGTLGIRLQRTVRVTADEEGKTAELIIEGENLEVDTQILDALIEPLLHLLRNAVAHGIESPETRRLLGKPETGRIRVSVHDEGTHVILNVADDGRGISAAALKEKALKTGFVNQAEAEAMTDEDTLALVFLPGLTTADEISQISGRGVGMNIVKTNIARQQGTISINSEAHKGTTFTIRLPMALAVTRALLVKAGEQTFAFPLKLVKHISRLSVVNTLLAGVGDQQQTAANINSKIEGNRSESSIFHLNDLLGLPSAPLPNDEDTPILLIETSGKPFALIVDEIIKPEEIVIKPLGVPLQNLAEMLGATVLGDGSVAPVLDLMYLLKQKIHSSDAAVQAAETKAPSQPAEEQTASGKRAPRAKLTVMIVDDSPSVRHLTSNIVKDAGWTVTIAKDGLEALDILQAARELPDVILTDVEMPRMDGYELLASLKKQENLRMIPVIMITSRAGDKHRQKAVDLGVSEYLIKPFNEAHLVAKIKDLSNINH